MFTFRNTCVALALLASAPTFAVEHPFSVPLDLTPMTEEEMAEIEGGFIPAVVGLAAGGADLHLASCYISGREATVPGTLTSAALGVATGGIANAGVVAAGRHISAQITYRGGMAAINAGMQRGVNVDYQ